jgi:arylsulfatase A-like enzyme
LQYPPTPASIAGLSTTEGRAVMQGIFRHDFDIGRALQAIRERHLLTDRTLVVLTADHNYPQASFLQGIPGFPNAPYTRIPFALLSGQPLPEAQRDRLHTQLDFAPTLAHLLGLPVPAGWWGQSVFLTNQPPPYVVKLKDNLLVSGNGQAQTISLAAPGTVQEQGLVRLFQSIFCETQPGKLNP